jgi:hypothetical protein
MKSEYLVVHDYGMGGLCAYVQAESEEEIVEAFPELQVMHERPGWMDDEQAATLDRLDLDAPSGLLAILLAVARRLRAGPVFRNVPRTAVARPTKWTGVSGRTRVA